MCVNAKKNKNKDHCPGKLDPTPGGVVEHNESHRDNEKRELLEEMGASIEDEEEDNKKDNNEITCKRLFTFKHVDDVVKCWGDSWEVTCHGSTSDLKLKETEVGEALRLSINELEALMIENPNDFMPDGSHALNLHF